MVSWNQHPLRVKNPDTRDYNMRCRLREVVPPPLDPLPMTAEQIRDKETGRMGGKRTQERRQA